MGGGGGWTPSRGELSDLEAMAKKALGESSGRRNVFISFASEDLNEVNLLRGQTENEHVPLDFNDHSVKEPIDSERAEYIKSKIRDKIDRASVTMVYLSEDSATSPWVDWEIRESLRKGKGVLGVHSGEAPPSRLPSAFQEHKLRVVPWNHKKLMSAIEAAAQ